MTHPLTTDRVDPNDKNNCRTRMPTRESGRDGFRFRNDSVAGSRRAEGRRGEPHSSNQTH